ncbi:hypothetical protein AURDEDRAFT_110849 [Auricularia subglabra TFB-10046 SS5]|nr:hypothetical protein AURDEDRAFT_110849 [Auricularia subglabra TFB-10046 SS5]
MWLLIGALAALSSASSARFAGIQDVDAFPKYAVSFLNALPVPNATAEGWLRDGLPGGESEFLDAAPVPAANVQQRIEGGDAQPAAEPATHVQFMKFGSAASYVCLIPAPRPLPHASEELEPAPAPSKTWELLQPLSGKCLYHRQGWFTYSYCHGQHVRQFRELPDQATIAFPPVAKVPEEDPEYPSYTLGKSAQAEDGSISEAANNLELARGTGQRYLHFRWGDGTVCDKTGKKRQIEVQFHCATSVTDSIVFVKETRTCEYTLVIHTPRLCSEPGFRRVLDDLPAQAIRCREVLPANAQADGVRTIPAQPEEPPLAGEAIETPQGDGSPPSLHKLFESEHPKQYVAPKKMIIPVRTPGGGVGVKDKGGKAPGDKNAALREILESLLGTKLDLPKGDSKAGAGASDKQPAPGAGAGSDANSAAAGAAADDALTGALADLPVYQLRQRRLANGEVVFEFALSEEDEEYDDEYDDDYEDVDDDYLDDDELERERANTPTGQKKLTVLDALRAAGYDVRALYDHRKPASDPKKAPADSQKGKPRDEKASEKKRQAKPPKKATHVEL